jgi:hypothetical protein
MAMLGCVFERSYYDLSRSLQKYDKSLLVQFPAIHNITTKVGVPGRDKTA